MTMERKTTIWVGTKTDDKNKGRNNSWVEFFAGHF